MWLVRLASVWLVALLGCKANIGDSTGSDAQTSVTFDAPVSAVDAPVIADAPAPPDAMPCVEGDMQVTDPTNGTCYMLFATVTNWQTARTACEQIGAHLAVSTSQAENDLFSPLAALAPDVWVGGNDIAMEGTWVWVNDEPMPYTNWRTGEPNNSSTTDPMGEDCMIIEGDNGGLWDDRSCLNEYGYICER